LENEFATQEYHLRYREALNHLQAGRWNEAIAGFQAMLQEYPDDTRLKQALDKARLKASLDSKTRIRTRRWQISWRLILFRSLAVLTILVVLAMGFIAVSTAILPALTHARAARQQAQLLSQGRAYLNNNELDRAEASFNALLSQVPDSPEAQRGILDIHAQREILSLYLQAVKAQEQQDFGTALAALNELSQKSPGYRDINARIADISKLDKISTLFKDAEANFNDGQNKEAVDKYLQIKALDTTYQTSVINDRLFAAYVRLGRSLVEQVPPSPTDIPFALEYFNQALAIKPRDPGTMQEKNLADLFIKGQSAYQAGRWHDVTIPLRTVYDSRPGYLGNVVVTMLYDAYIRSGDQYIQDNDIYRAYDDYLNASHLPVPNLTLAEGRLAQLLPSITPTSTPEPSPTPEPTLTPQSPAGGGGEVTPRTPVPTPTPTPYTLSVYKNRIIYRSLNPGQLGFWVVDPDGSNRKYLGNTPVLAQAYKDLQSQYEYSPDRRSVVFVQGPDEIAQIFVTIPDDNTHSTSTQQLTRSQGASYDPAWSPDGNHIVYVSEETGSDDIWVMAPDGKDAQNLTPNNAYDKHPSWSPDNRSIVFWSNRAGVQQIFVMDADGKNVRNISNSPWDEYDPLWVR
jgi:tetratricopeptide (TPR) repeat protein